MVGAVADLAVVLDLGCAFVLVLALGFDLDFALAVPYSPCGPP